MTEQLRKTFTVTKAGEPEVLISSGSVDRDGDTINPSGWKIDTFKRNPVVLFAHDQHSPPVGRCTSIEKTKDGLLARWKWADEVYDFAKTIRDLWEGRFLSGCSVGFRPIKWSRSDDEDRPWGMDFKEQELLEFSVVPIPSNPDAVRRAVKAMGRELEASEDFIDLDAVLAEHRRLKQEIILDF